MCEKSAKKPYRFGRIKPGGPPALRLAIPAGLVIATVIGIVLQSAPVFPTQHHERMAQGPADRGMRRTSVHRFGLGGGG